MGQKGEIRGKAVGSVVGNSKGERLSLCEGGDLCVFVCICMCVCMHDCRRLAVRIV